MKPVTSVKRYTLKMTIPHPYVLKAIWERPTCMNCGALRTLFQPCPRGCL